MTAPRRRRPAGLMVTTFHGSESVDLTATARDVFDLLVDIDRLPVWNARIHHVIDGVDGRLRAGDEWVVQMRAMGRRWPTRSRASLVDRIALRFEHTARTDDGNPSRVDWTWQVIARERGCRLTVTWAGYPRSFWRALVLARVRPPVLAAEVRASLAQIDTALPGCSRPAVAAKHTS